MKSIHLFQFKESISLKIPFFDEQSQLTSLNDLMAFDLINTEKVTEFIIETSDDFVFENTKKEDLLTMCKDAKETIDHYFRTVVNDYDALYT